MNSELRKLFSSFILHEPRYATAPRPRSPSRVSRRGFTLCALTILVSLSILMEVEKDGEKMLRKEKVAICFIGCTLSSCHESAHSASESELSLGAPSHHSTLSRARGEPRCVYVARTSGRVAHFSTALTARSTRKRTVSRKADP